MAVARRIRVVALATQIERDQFRRCLRIYSCAVPESVCAPNNSGGLAVPWSRYVCALIAAHRPSFTNHPTTRGLSGRVLCSASTSPAVVPVAVIVPVPVIVPIAMIGADPNPAWANFDLLGLGEVASSYQGGSRKLSAFDPKRHRCFCNSAHCVKVKNPKLPAVTREALMGDRLSDFVQSHCPGPKIEKPNA
jgi:hypothetical protein